MLSNLQVMRKFSKLWMHSNMDCQGVFVFVCQFSQQTIFTSEDTHTHNKSKRQFEGCVSKHKIKNFF